jgi:hypothetical protein
MVHGKINGRVADDPKNLREAGVSVQEKAVGNEPNMGGRPTIASQQHEIAQIGMNRRFASQQRKNSRGQPFVPEVHPSTRVVEGDMPLMAVIGIMRAALARKVATVSDVKLQVGQRLHLCPSFRRPNVDRLRRNRTTSKESA